MITNLTRRPLRLLLQNIILTVIAITACPISALASSGKYESQAEVVLKEHLDSLSNATTANESIAMLYDMFDILPETQRKSHGQMLYQLVRRTHGDKEAFDVLLMLTTVYKSDSEALCSILKEAMTFPESDLRSEVMLFTKIYLAKKQAQMESMVTRKEKLADMITPNGPTAEADRYSQLLKLFTICVYTREVTQGTLLIEQLQYLDRTIKSQPLQTYAIRRQYAEMKADIFTVNDNPEDAVKADKELLDVVSEMERVYEIQERKHLALHWYRYRAYSRLLQNFRATTLKDTETYYQAINALADSMPEIRVVYDSFHYPDIYYLLKRKEYAKVRPLIFQALEKETDKDQRRFLFRQLMDVADALDDTQLRLYATKQYIPMLENFINDKASESSREMEIIYKLGRMRKDAIDEEIKTQQETSRQHNTTIVSITVAIVLMVGLVIALIIFSLKFLRTGRELKLTNRKLTSRRDELRNGQNELLEAIQRANITEKNKTSFIKYISSTISLPLSSIMEYSAKIINSSDAAKRRFLERFALVIQENYEQLNETAIRLQKLARGDQQSITDFQRPTRKDSDDNT